MAMSILIRRRHLPHWDVPGACYFVTSCLEGSIPAQGLLDIGTFEKRLEGLVRPRGMSERDWKSLKWRRLFSKVDHWLDTKPAVRHFDNEELALILKQAIYHFAGDRYDLFSYSIMPSHFHWVFRPREEWVKSLGPSVRKRTPRERIMHSIKRYSALECNRILGKQGTFWLEESYDHVVRDEDEFLRIVDYVETNPVKAGLVGNRRDWQFSSAYDRLAAETQAVSSPLTRDVFTNLHPEQL